MSLIEKRLEKFDEKFPIYCWNTEDNRWEKVRQKEIGNFLKESMEMVENEVLQEIKTMRENLSVVANELSDFTKYISEEQRRDLNEVQKQLSDLKKTL